MAKENWIVTQLKNSSVYFLILLVGVVIFGTRLQEQVIAIEKRNARVDPLVERFFQLETRDKTLIDDVEQIKKDVRQLLIINGGEITN